MTPGLFTAEEIAVPIPPPTPRPAWYVVVSFYVNGPWWKLHGVQFVDEATAIHFTESLPKCWTNHRVFRIAGEGAKP